MRNQTAADVMTAPVATVTPELLVTDALREAARHGAGGLPVVDAQQRLVGIITEHDFMTFLVSGEAGDSRVQEAMSPEVVTVAPDTDLVALATVFVQRHLRLVPVVDAAHHVLGVVRRQDILRAMLALY